MLWTTTRDLVIQALTITKATDGKLDKHIDKFDRHVEKEETQFDGLAETIANAHNNCSESGHIKDQNGLLKDVKKENKATYDEVILIKAAIRGIEKRGSGRRELFHDMVRVMTLACVVVGCFYGYSRYCDATKIVDNKKIEAMFEKLLEKKNNGITK